MKLNRLGDPATATYTGHRVSFSRAIQFVKTEVSSLRPGVLCHIVEPQWSWGGLSLSKRGGGRHVI